MHFHQITGGLLQQNAYLYGEEGALFLIDPGSHAKDWLDYLQEQDLKLTALLLTHGHFDHVGAVDALRDALGVPLWMHEADHIMLSDFEWRGGHNKTPLRPADRFLSDGEQVGNMTVWHTPGHSLGSVCYIAPDRVFTGDTLFEGTIGRTDFRGGSFETMQKSLSRLRTLPAELEIYAGHGEATTVARELAYNPYLRG